MNAPRTLAELVASAGLRPRRLIGDGGVAVTAITHDSRRVSPGALFCCVSGERVDGHMFATAALASGAVALLVEREVAVAAPQVVVDEVRPAMGLLAAAVHGHPSHDLLVAGITGTNGKTTTAHLLAAILEADGRPTTLIGTLTGTHTTPEAPDLQASLAAARDAGQRAVVMEVSSHGLALHRPDGTQFAVTVFTNLQRDHLDFHGTVERYFAAKARLFTPEFTDLAVVCTDDPHGSLLLDAAPVTRKVGYRIADAVNLELTVDGSTFDWDGARLHVPIAGRFNVLNALGAATAARELGVPVAAIAAGLASAPPVPGRVQRVDAGQPFTVIVDYAHTPDGVEALLRTARELVPGRRVLVVLGAGGDRDRTKRPAMGAAAVGGADVVVLTNDNPRSEDPLAIIDEVRSGTGPVPAGVTVHVEPDRRRAIRLALRSAAPGDVVVIAGKGHEVTQTVGDEVRPFDDRIVAREEIEELLT